MLDSEGGSSRIECLLPITHLEVITLSTPTPLPYHYIFVCIQESYLRSNPSNSGTFSLRTPPLQGLSTVLISRSLAMFKSIYFCLENSELQTTVRQFSVIEMLRPMEPWNYLFPHWQDIFLTVSPGFKVFQVNVEIWKDVMGSLQSSCHN